MDDSFNPVLVLAISSHKCCDNLVSHEDVDKDASEEGECSAGLGDDQEVDNSVEDPGSNKDSEHKLVSDRKETCKHTCSREGRWRRQGW